jgi:hypothetical protein
LPAEQESLFYAFALGAALYTAKQLLWGRAIYLPDNFWSMTPST